MLIEVLIALALVAAVVGIVLSGGHKRHRARERMRATSGTTRAVSSDFLKDAERELRAAESSLVATGRVSDARELDSVRADIARLADKTRAAYTGDAAMFARNGVLPTLLEHDEQTLALSNAILDAAQVTRRRASDGELDCVHVRVATQVLEDALAARKQALNEH